MSVDLNCWILGHGLIQWRANFAKLVHMFTQMVGWVGFDWFKCKHHSKTCNMGLLVKGVSWEFHNFMRAFWMF